MELKNRFICLLLEDDCEVNTGQEEEGEVAGDNEVEKKWKKIKDTYCETAKDVLGYRTRKNKSWISQKAGRELKKGNS